MPITTSISPMYGGQKIFAMLLCLVFGIWGWYDYSISIPRQEVTYAKYEELTARIKELETENEARRARNELPSADQLADYTNAKNELAAVAPGGDAPTKPHKFNRAIQWVYIACLPFVPYFLWLFIKAKRQSYTLDEQGTLSFVGDPEHQSGQWNMEEIREIDMDRWMAKSIAYAVHADGRRLKLDAYLHKNLHLIIGAIASRLYPEKWDREAKIVKVENEVPEPASDLDEPSAAVSENATT